MLPIHDTFTTIQAPPTQTGRAVASKPRADTRPALHGASRVFRFPRFAPGALRIFAGAPGRWRPGGTRLQAFRHEPADLLHGPAKVRRKRKQRVAAGQAWAQGAVEAFSRGAEICAHSVRSSAGGVGCRTGLRYRSEVRHFDPQEDDRKIAGRVRLKKKLLSHFSRRHTGDHSYGGQIRRGRLTRGCVPGFWRKLSLRSRRMRVGSGLYRTDSPVSLGPTRVTGLFPFTPAPVHAGRRKSPTNRNYCMQYSAGWQVRWTGAGRSVTRKE